MANHGRETSVPHIRLAQRLPPLPNSRPHQLSILIPYRDDPDGEDEVEELEGLPTQRSPPGYEPMYDYLRSQQRPASEPTSNGCLNTFDTSSEAPYRDQPFIIAIIDTDDDTSQPPPSYTEIYSPNEIEMRNLLQHYDLNGTPAEQTEEMCKWILAMLFIALTIAAAGTAFNWGQPSCRWPNKTESIC